MGELIDELNAAIINGELPPECEEAVDWLQRYALSHPTPVQGEALPVVAYRWHWTSSSDGYDWTYTSKKPTHSSDIVVQSLTDHAQATAEIARLQGEVESLKYQIGSGELAAQELERQTDYLRTQLSDTTGQVGKLREALEKIYEIAPYLGRGYAGEIAVVCKAALNSTAQESKT